jgi:plasmid replication initiation protein
MDKNYLVTKSNYFIMNSSYDLSLEEQKLILTLASMVQPTDEEFKPYEFRIAEFMELLGVEDKSKYTQIPKITKELMKKVFEIQEGNKIIQTAWISGAIYEKGSGMVTLKFNPDLKPYMLLLKEKFTQYQLANVLTMKSKYSPRIYEILKCNEFKKQGYTEIEVDELRKLLKADNIYPKYNDFKRKVIEQAQKELKALTDILFDFEEIKTGRKVTAIRFYIKSNIKKKQNENDEVCAALQERIDEEDAGKLQKVINVCEGDIDNLVNAKKLLDAAGGNMGIIKEKHEMSKHTNYDDYMGWMIAAIKEDWKPSKRGYKKTRFGDYDQRTYDVKELEKMVRANLHENEE